MSKLAEIAQRIERFEMGAKEWPGFKREWRYLLSNPFTEKGRERILQGTAVQDVEDWYNFMLRHFITANEIIFIASPIVHNADKLEIAANTALIVAVSETGKYLADRLVRNSDRIYQSKIFQEYAVPVLKPIVELEVRLLTPFARYLDRKPADYLSRKSTDSKP